MSWSKTYSKILNPTKFMFEVQASTIAVCMLSVGVIGNSSTPNFKAPLTAEEELILDALVTAHDASAMAEQQIVTTSIIEVPAYAVNEVDMSYRERTYGLSSGVTLNPAPIIIQFKYPIILLGGDLPIRSDMVGDIAELSMHPFYETGDICGTITENCVAGESHIEVSQEMAQFYLFKGFNLFLTDGATFEEPLGEVWRKEGARLYVDSIPTNRPAGTYVKAHYKIIPRYVLNMHPHRVTIAENTQRGTYIGVGWALKFSYINTTLTDKPVEFSVEYYI